jgi:hypothetical protein
MWSEDSNAWTCDICAGVISYGEPVVRISGDTAFCDGEGFEDAGPRRVRMFAVFHSHCVLDAIYSETAAAVDYVEEAGEVLAAAPLCDCCEQRMTPPSARRSLFSVIDGGAKERGSR